MIDNSTSCKDGHHKYSEYIICQNCGEKKRINLIEIEKFLTKSILEDIRANCIDKDWYTVEMNVYLNTRIINSLK